MKTIPDKSVDLIICDLPYGCLGPEKAGGSFPRGGTDGVFSACLWDIKIDLEAFWKQIKRIRRSDHSPTIHFCTTKFGYDLIKSNEKEFRYELVWNKQRGVSFLTANRMPMRSHEMIYIFSKAGAFYERKDIISRCVLSVIPNPGTLKKGNHPTEKPCDLYRFLIERYCPANGTVLDPTFGSGNSVFTAFAMGRNAIGIEKDETFYKKAEEKLNELP
jgi:site-specific DNA-methyltransferase (adenine-specific)